MSKLEVAGNAKEVGSVPVLAFSRGREVAAQMAAQPTSISGLEGLGAAGSDSGRKHWNWVPDLPLPWGWWGQAALLLGRGSEWEGACCGIQGRSWPHLFQSHLEHLLCVSHQARLSTRNHSLEGVVFTSEPKTRPCCQVDLLSPRLTLLSTDGIFFLKNEPPGDGCQLPAEPQHRPLWGSGPGIADAVSLSLYNTGIILASHISQPLCFPTSCCYPILGGVDAIALAALVDPTLQLVSQKCWLL